jgi:putative nucleotidyltransferase with HDIG domain
MALVMPTDAPPQLPLDLAVPRSSSTQRLHSIVEKGLPPFRQTALELTKALGEASPDLKKASKLIAADPTLSSQVLRMCNSPLLGLHSRVISIDRAAALLGPERLRSLALTSSVADFAGKALSDSQMSGFWQHSFMAAMLSQFLAEKWKYFDKDQAYIAGLLHDIGRVPEWILLAEETGGLDAPSHDWIDNTKAERAYFGTDHCELGGIMAGSWGLMPSFLDVLENHHAPEVARRDSVLVRIVATIEYFLLDKAQGPPLAGNDERSPKEPPRFVQLGQGLFGEIGWPSAEQALEQEYNRILPIAEAGLDGILGSNGNSTPDLESVPAHHPNLRTSTVSPNDKAALAIRGVQNIKSESSSTFLSRCKSFMKLFVS